jgi:hypothetical protein
MSQPSPARLGDFVSACEEALGWLATDYDFAFLGVRPLATDRGAQGAFTSDRTVPNPLGAANGRFQSRHVEVNVWHDPRAELSLTVRRRGWLPAPSVDLHHMLLAAGVENAGSISGGRYDSGVGTLSGALIALGQTLQRHGTPWLRGRWWAFIRAAWHAGL